MTFHLNRLVLVAILSISTLFSAAQKVPKATGFVMDEAGLFSQEERRELEMYLQALDDSTSNEIAVYTTLDLQGYDPYEVALKYLRDNGLGQKKANNGVVILIKPKQADSKGEAFIATGYGLEGALPDVICKRVVENEMIPQFKQGNYFGGTVAAVQTVGKLASGEISVKTYGKKKSGKDTPGTFLILIIVGVAIFIFASGNRRYAGRNNLPFWLALGLFNSVGSRHRGSWDGFSGGGGGGGFGGFGGGSGGGGGAGGSW